MSTDAPAQTESLVGRVVLRYERLIRPDDPFPFELLALPMGEVEALHMAAYSAVVAERTVVEQLLLVARLKWADTDPRTRLHAALVNSGAASLLGERGEQLAVEVPSGQWSYPPHARIYVDRLSYSSPYELAAAAAIASAASLTAFRVMVRAMRALWREARGFELDNAAHDAALARLRADKAEEAEREARALSGIETIARENRSRVLSVSEGEVDLLDP